MPLAAIGTGLVDAVIPIELMPQFIARALRRRSAVRDHASWVKPFSPRSLAGKQRARN